MADKFYDIEDFSGKGDKIFFTSDTHFGHGSIIDYCKRPFRDVEHMNSELVRLWNEKVPEDGIVFHLGDFALGGSGFWKDIVSKLNGDVHIILGNHDYKNFRPSYKDMFASVSLEKTIEVGGHTIWLNHMPYLCFPHSWEGYDSHWNLFGHVHSGKGNETGLDCMRMRYLFPTQYDVGVDNNDYAPVSYREVEEKIMKQCDSQGLLNFTYNPDSNANILERLSEDRMIMKPKGIK